MTMYDVRLNSTCLQFSLILKGLRQLLFDGISLFGKSAVFPDTEGIETKRLLEIPKQVYVCSFP